MRLPEEERARYRAAFRAMSLPQKAEYVFAYYKLPLVLALVAIVSAVSIGRYFLTHKESLLYVAYANVELTDEDDARIFDGYLRERGANARTTQVSRYYDLYLCDPEGSVDHQYSYASRVKLLATIDAEELDVVLMSKGSYDLLSHSGYLADLPELLATGDPKLLAQVQDLLQSNDVIIEDNQVELDLGEADAYEATTEPHVNAIEADTLPAFASIDLNEHLYLGVIGNTPRTDEVLSLIAYLCGQG